MKNLIILFLIFFSSMSSMSGQVVFFEDFDGSSCESNGCLCCYVNFIDDNSCLPGWFAPHGTPNTLSNTNPLPSGYFQPSISGKAVSMFACGGHDGGGVEGLAAYFRFRRHFCYKISFRIFSKNNNEGALFTVRAARNLVHDTSIGNCCDVLPTVDFKEIKTIPLPPLSDTDFEKKEFFFYPEENWDQLWFYPNVSYVIIDDVQIEQICSPRIDYTDPISDIPSGLTKALVITTSTPSGSSPNSFIDNSPNAQTEFLGSDFILLSPQTNLTALNSGFFLAHLEACKDEIPEECRSDRALEIRSEIFGEENNELNDYSSREQQIKIFPNPAKDLINIETLNKELMYEVEIFNQSGTIVSSIEDINSDAITISVNDLQPGIYIVKIKLINNVLMRKLFIIK